MTQIHVLSSDTINRIAAGEVVERPANVVKELTENAIDAGARAITIEIRGGGMDLIRVTDNGCGIAPGEVSRAFLRHTTSKIESADDLMELKSLGFRGEALSSIAAVAEVEMITKTADSLFGIRAVNDPMNEEFTDADISMQLSEIGAPDGTTVIVRNLFCNVPVRRKFLKSAQTEGSYVTDLVEQLSLSHPDISFHYRMNGLEKLHTTGNGSVPELIYRIYGRDLSRSVVPFAHMDEAGGIEVTGYLGRPEFSRSSRSCELFYVNGRILRSDILSKGLEEGYRTDLMKHRFPFAIVYLTVPAQKMDVNVHPSKMEVKFTDPKEIYDLLNESVHSALHNKELIPRETMNTKAEEAERQKEALRRKEEEQQAQPHLEAFERSPAAAGQVQRTLSAAESAPFYGDRFEEEEFSFIDKTVSDVRFEQESLFRPQESAGKEEEKEEGSGAIGEDPHILTRENARRFKYIGQIFDTYWIIEFENQMLMIDQHAAHEKVNFERLMARLERDRQEPAASQILMPPIIVTLSGREEAALEQYMDYFIRMGYEIEPFGENAYALRAVPAELYANEPDALLREILDEILESRMSGTPAAILYKIASLSCKAAVKGNTKMSLSEAQDLIDELLSLDNPYHCPHGRPTMIVLSQAEIDRKFKRIVS